VKGRGETTDSCGRGYQLQLEGLATISHLNPRDMLTDEGIASLALLQMASDKSDEMPDPKEMHRIICYYGPETPLRHLDLSFLTPSACYWEPIFKAFNPTFAKRFYRTRYGDWLPHMGACEERMYRQNNRSRLIGRKRGLSVMISLPKGEMILFDTVS
jgi:hypothetical protein